MSEEMLKSDAPKESNHENGSSTEDDAFVQLSDSVRMYSNQKLAKSAQVHVGWMESGKFGNQKVAVKYLPYDKSTEREVEILEKLGRHENVVTFFESNLYNGGPFPALYIAMELCQRLNLQDRIVKNKENDVPFDPECSLLHAKQIALGVDFIHKKGIINRDLKPQNILISLDGKNLKVADFGLSKPLRYGRSMTRQSFRGAGTDGFRAPETYNQDVISHFSDIYSLALVFYFIWSYGCHPFGDDVDDWNSNIKKNRDRDLSRLLIPDESYAKHLLKWMLQMTPKKRPTAEQILNHPVFSKSSKIEDFIRISEIEIKDTDKQDGDQRNGSAKDSTDPKPHAASVTKQAILRKVQPQKTGANRLNDRGGIGTYMKQGPRNDSLSRIGHREEVKNGQGKWNERSYSKEGERIGSGGSATRNDGSFGNRTSQSNRNGEKPWNEGSETKNDRERLGTERTKLQEEDKSLEAILEEENCQNLMKEQHFVQALMKLNNIVKQGRNELSTKLLIAECNFQIGREEAAKRVIDEIAENDTTSIHEIKALVEDSLLNSHYIRCMILLHCLYWCYKRSESSTEKVVGIESCGRKMLEMMKPMSKEGGKAVIVAYSIGFPSLFQMYDTLKEVEGVPEDIKTLKVVGCVSHIGSCYHELGQNEKAVQYYEEGLKMFYEYFGDGAPRYHIFGGLKNNAATAHHYIGHYEEAQRLYMESIEDIQRALDFNNETERQVMIADIYGNLQRTQNMLM